VCAIVVIENKTFFYCKGVSTQCLKTTMPENGNVTTAESTNKDIKLSLLHFKNHDAIEECRIAFGGWRFKRLDVRRAVGESSRIHAHNSKRRLFKARR